MSAIHNRRRPAPGPLTLSEIGVAACLLDGLSNKAIVLAGVAPTPKAVEDRMKSMRRKLGCHSGRALIVLLAHMAMA